MEGMINMKKILVLAIMALGISTNVFACFGNSMIESIIADKIIRSKELEDITKKEMKLIKKCRLEDSLAYKIASSKAPEEITEKEMKLIKKHGYEFLLSDEFRKQIKKEMTKNLEKKK